MTKSKTENICSNCGHERKVHINAPRIDYFRCTHKINGLLCPCKKFQAQNQARQTKPLKTLTAKGVLTHGRKEDKTAENTIFTPFVKNNQNSIGSKPEDVVAGAFDNHSPDLTISNGTQRGNSERGIFGTEDLENEMSKLIQDTTIDTLHFGNEEEESLFLYFNLEAIVKERQRLRSEVEKILEECKKYYNHDMTQIELRELKKKLGR